MGELIHVVSVLGIPLLALAGLGCLLFGRGRSRRNLAWCAAVFAGTLVLLAGGGFVLKCLGLAWRNGPARLMLAALLVEGWAGIVLTLICLLPMERPGLPAPLWTALKGVTVLFAGLVIFFTLWLGPLLIFMGSEGEQVVEIQGQSVLEVDDGFLDPHYSYYACHGPLVRGRERLWSGDGQTTHIWGDAD